MCFCGNIYDTYPEVPKSSCNADCPADSSQICGGDYANSVYDTELTCDCLKQKKENPENEIDILDSSSGGFSSGSKVSTDLKEENFDP